MTVLYTGFWLEKCAWNHAIPGKRIPTCPVCAHWELENHTRLWHELPAARKEKMRLPSCPPRPLFTHTQLSSLGGIPKKSPSWSWKIFLLPTKAGWFGRMALKHVYHHMLDGSPVQVDAWDRVLRAGALGWPWGMGWGRRWEGGSEWGHMHTHGGFMSMYGKANTIL